MVISWSFKSETTIHDRKMVAYSKEKAISFFMVNSKCRQLDACIRKRLMRLMVKSDEFKLFGKKSG